MEEQVQKPVIQQTPFQPVNVPPVSPEPKKTNLPIFLIVIFLMVLVGLGGIAVGKYLNFSQTTQPQPTLAPGPILISTPTSIINITPNPEGDLNSNWKTYTGITDYGSGKFSIMYPSTWEQNKLYDIDKVFYPLGSSNKGFSVSLGQAGAGLPEWIQCKTQILTAGMAKYCTGKNEGKVYLSATFDKENLSYIFRMAGIPEEYEVQYKNIFDKMVNTFTILDQNQSDNWLTYTHTKFTDKPDFKIPWKGFTLYYPSSWELTENKNTENPSLDLKITKSNDDYFEIIQGAGGGGYCLFPDQVEYNSFQGMATKYTKYQEIKKNEIIWRLADWPTQNDLWTHQLCEKFDSNLFKIGYKDSTAIGFTKIRVTTPESVQELNGILNKLVILN